MKSPRPDINTALKKTWTVLFDRCLNSRINPFDDPAFPNGGDIRKQIDFFADKIRSSSS